MASRTWARVGSSLWDIDPAKNPALNPNYPDAAPWRGVGGFGNIIAAWSGAAYHRGTDTLRLHGGGHMDYAGNELVDIDLCTEAPSWRLERAPSGATGNLGPTQTADDYGGDEASGVYWDGRPRSNHTYNNLCWAGNEFYNFGGSQHRSGNSVNQAFKYAADWVGIGLNPGPGQGAICHDTLRNRICIGSRGSFPAMTHYDIATGTWSVDVNSVLQGAGQYRLVYAASLDVVVLCGLTGIAVYDFERTPGSRWPAPTVLNGPIPHGAFTGEWVPEYGARGALIQWSGGTGFDVVEPPASGNPATAAWTYSRLEADPSNAIDPGGPNGNGVYGRFFYSPRLRLLGVLIDGYVNVFALPERPA